VAARGICAFSLSALAACASSSQLVTGTARAPLSADAVKVYTQAPRRFEEIAVLEASRDSLTAAGGERAIAKMIDVMKQRSGRLGANGLLLEDFSDSPAVGVGGGVGSDAFTHNGSISLALGGAIGFVKKSTKARAIFVPPG
jgi:hypothetical protein